MLVLHFLIKAKWLKIFKSILLKHISLFQMLIHLTSFKKKKITIVNCCVTIKAIMFVEKFLGSYLTSFLGRSVFGFIIIKPVSEFNFGFSNIWDIRTHLLLHSHNLKGHIKLWKFPHRLPLKSYSSLKVFYIKQVFFPHFHHLPVLLVLGNAPPTTQSLSTIRSYSMYIRKYLLMFPIKY